MNSWPQIHIPATSRTLPALRLQTSAGSSTLETTQEFLMYVCGITPYDATHLGHAATYLSFDLINRYRQLQGARVCFVENITDIDEPLLERAQRDSVDWQELASQQIDLYRSDMTALHVAPPQHFIPATTVMDLIDIAIQRMDKNGYVYRLENDIYFDITSFVDRLPLKLDAAIASFAEKGGDPSRLGKRHPLDPILWLAHKDGEPGWASSHGFGRPGWHIECSVISLRYLLGDDYLESKDRDFSIDLQGGGSDLLFPHHFMSGAQAEALLGRPFAKNFVHSGMIGLDGEKMSKSKGNLVFVSSLLQTGIDPVIIRYALLRDHYQSDRMWSDEKLQSATRSVNLIRSALSREEVLNTESLCNEIILSISDNLNTPYALAALEAWATATTESETSSSADQQGSGELTRLLDSLLGLAF